MDFQLIKDFRNQNSPYTRQLDIIIETIELGYARVTKTVTETDLNSIGLPHGGVYISMADTACASAAASHGFQAVTLSNSYNYFRSARVGDRLTAEARETKYGKTICVSEATVRDQDNHLLGTGTFTFYLLNQNLEIVEPPASV